MVVCRRLLVVVARRWRTASACVRVAGAHPFRQHGAVARILRAHDAVELFDEVDASYFCARNGHIHVCNGDFAAALLEGWADAKGIFTGAIGALPTAEDIFGAAMDSCG
jgi:hypothetical protein